MDLTADLIARCIRFDAVDVLKSQLEKINTAIINGKLEFVTYVFDHIISFLFNILSYMYHPKHNTTVQIFSVDLFGCKCEFGLAM